MLRPSQWSQPLAFNIFFRVQGRALALSFTIGDLEAAASTSAAAATAQARLALALNLEGTTLGKTEVYSLICLLFLFFFIKMYVEAVLFKVV